MHPLRHHTLRHHGHRSPSDMVSRAVYPLTQPQPQPDFGDFADVMKQRRAERALEDKERKARLAREYAESERVKKEAHAKELAVIAKIEAELVAKKVGRRLVLWPPPSFAPCGFLEAHSWSHQPDIIPASPRILFRAARPLALHRRGRRTPSSHSRRPGRRRSWCLTSAGDAAPAVDPYCHHICCHGLFSRTPCPAIIVHCAGRCLIGGVVDG